MIGRSARELHDAIEALRDAALHPHSPDLDPRIAALSQVNPQRVLPRLLAGLTDDSRVAEASGRVAWACLEKAARRSFWAIDRSLRARWMPAIAADRVDWLDATLERGRAGALALASMQRDGWARARAIEALSRGPLGSLELCLVIVRLNDPVDAVARRAQSCVEARLDRALIEPIVGALPVIEGARQTVRAGKRGVIEAIEELLGRDDRRLFDALERAAAAADPDLRVAAISRCARACPDSARAMRLLTAGLADREPRVRRAVAELIARGELSSELSDPLLPALERARSPAVRLLALRWRRRLGDQTALLRACFDRNAALRHYARRYHRGVGGRADYRGMALARLRGERAEPELDLVGALATLADLGRTADRECIEPFASHPSRRVADEARRTLARLALADS